ncbi:hypothetical protein ACFXTO_000441 [Malus domestica]
MIPPLIVNCMLYDVAQMNMFSQKISFNLHQGPIGNTQRGLRPIPYLIRPSPWRSPRPRRRSLTGTSQSTPSRRRRLRRAKQESWQQRPMRGSTLSLSVIGFVEVCAFRSRLVIELVFAIPQIFR